ncbi:MAG: LCCL domain-containing protein [bacterium]|jgi:hypothetical protein
MKYIICPPNCHKESKVIGRNAYHPNTNLCAAAIIDNSIPITGGLVGIVRISGQGGFS